MGVVLITHYQRLLDELQPDHVHILVGGASSRAAGWSSRRSWRSPGTRRSDDGGGARRPGAAKHFPIFDREIEGQPIVYLDSANTSQKPREVIDAMSTFMETAYAPINRSAYRLAAEATDAYEGGPSKVRRFINARHAREVVFTKNATESLNLVASSWGRSNLRTGDVVVSRTSSTTRTSSRAHARRRAGIELRWVPLTGDGQLDLTDLPGLLDGAKAFSFTAMSNVLGTITPVRQL
jgi:cysteine desulfurase/selenocysteine lyase